MRGESEPRLGKGFGSRTTPLEKGFAIVSGALVGADVAATLHGLPRSGLLELGGGNWSYWRCICGRKGVLSPSPSGAK